MIIFPYFELVIVSVFALTIFILLWITISKERTKSKLIREISFAVTAAIDLESLGITFFNSVSKTMGTAKGFIAVVENGNTTWCQGYKMEASAIDGDLIHTMILELLEDQKATVFETKKIKHAELKKFLLEQAIDVMIPLAVHKELSGVVLLGSKARGNYSHEELTILREIEPVLTVTLKNAVSYNKLAEISSRITEKEKHADEEIKAAQQAVKAMDVSKDEFISIASHELRTPITAIKGYLWICLNQVKEPLPEDVKKNIETCYHSAERLLRMVSDMLTVTRLDENKMQLNIQKVDIASLLNNLHEEMTAVAKPREINFTLKLAKPSIMIEGDRERLQELFHNIMDNALKFVPHRGFVHIELQENDNRDISVLISDNGPGIPKENMDTLFTKFGKIPYAYDKTHAVEGAGLGLYIGKKIVDLHSGIISVESEVDKGTTFIITLPLRLKKQ